MLTREEHERARQRAIAFFDKAGIVITDEEKGEIEVADFGLSDLDTIGIEVLTYINTERVCAKEIIMFPGQACPEHIHPTRNGVPGKEETFRCRWGQVYLYVPIDEDKRPKKKPDINRPKGYEEYLTCKEEIILNPGEQYTLMPDTRHWFKAGTEGAVVSEFSTTSTDAQDVFTDPEIERFTRLKE